MWMKKSQINKELDSECIEETKNIKWIKHKDKKILYIDYSNRQTTDEFLDVIQEVNNFIKKLGEYNLILLVDVRNSIANEKITVDSLKNNALTVKPYVRKSAVVGVIKTQEIILTVVNMFSNLGLKPFDTIEGAKEWLVE
jgi:hypothetical protein